MNTKIINSKESTPLSTPLSSLEHSLKVGLGRQNQQPIHHLLVIEDQLGKRIVPLEATTCTIGRDLKNTIVLYSEMVSRHHAILLRVTTPQSSTHQFRMVDGNLQGKRSTNGLFINGNKCYSHNLEHGDEVIFGDEVKTRYITTANPRDIDFLTSCEAEDMSGFLSELNDPFQTCERRAKENSGEASLIRLASFPELLMNPITEIDLLGNITYLNPAALTKFPTLKHKKLEHPILHGLIETIQNGPETSFDREIVCDERIYTQSIHYLASSDLIRSYLVDITEQKRIQAALRVSERRFRAIFNQTFQFSWLLMPDGTLLEANQTALDFGGIALDSVINQPFWEAQWWSISSEIQENLKSQIAAASGGEFVRYEVEIQGKDNLIGTIDFSIKPLLDESGKVIMLIPEGRDISDRKTIEKALQSAHDQLEVRVQKRTYELKSINEKLTSEIVERQRAEEALRSSYATNRALLNAIPDWMFRINKNGVIVNYKLVDKKLLPLCKEDFMGKSIMDVLPKQIAQVLLRKIQIVLASNCIDTFEYQIEKEYDYFEFEARIAVSSNNEVMMIVRDITERKRAEDDIRHALSKERELNELKSRFVAMTSHEFRTPLATILSSAELLEHYSNKWTSEKKYKHLHRIQVAVHHMTGLLNDVLILGKAESGQLKFSPTPIRLIEFCEDLVESIQITTQSHQIILHTHITNVYINLDEKLLRHILGNLLSNAIKYSPDGGNIQFDLHQVNGHITFSIEDYGLGIPESDLPTIFNSFDRASNVGNISGTGLGLAIVHKSVSLHGGNIKVQSQEGKGTQFTVSIPYS